MEINDLRVFERFPPSPKLPPSLKLWRTRRRDKAVFADASVAANAMTDKPPGKLTADPYVKEQARERLTTVI